MLRAAAFLLAAGVIAAASLPALAASRPGEMRGAWMGEGYGRDWPTIMASLQQNGFNALFPNLCTGGAAYYPSDVLPRAAGWSPGRDELAEAAQAAREHGIELHVWRINWVLFHVPDDVHARYEAEGRLMRNWKGQLARDDPNLEYGVDWLCPSNPANRKLEKDAMLELVRKYDIAGIQFDYMRYPSPDYCFCDHCRASFEKDTGIRVEHWPDDVRGDGPYAQRYADWRRGLLTSLVADISREAHRIKPGIFVSLAAWPEVEVARNWVLQDWPAWIANGSLDFVCFMNYGTEVQQVADYLRAQVDLVNGAIPIYAGLGAFMMRSPWPLIEQVEAARAAGADGFVTFAYYSGDLDKWLPDLHATVTASDPGPMPHWSPPARFEFGGPAVAPPAGSRRVLSGAMLEVGLSLGARPPTPPSEEEAAGADHAATVLRRAAEPREPITTYGADRAGVPDLEARPRISGRVVVEDPAGVTKLALGAFDADYGLERTFRFPAPQGPFRLAIYGAAARPGADTRGFVLRSPLLTGMTREELSNTPETVHAELERAIAGVPAQLAPEILGDLECTVQIRATGPGGGEWWLRFAGGACEAGTGARDGADVRVTASAEDLVKVVRGQTSPRELFEAGRLAATGDPRLLEQLRRVVERAWRIRE